MQAIEMGAARIDQQAYLVRFGGTDATTSPSSGTDLRTVRYGSMSDRARPDTIPDYHSTHPMGCLPVPCLDSPSRTLLVKSVSASPFRRVLPSRSACLQAQHSNGVPV